MSNLPLSPTTTFLFLGSALVVSREKYQAPTFLWSLFVEIEAYVLWFQVDLKPSNLSPSFKAQTSTRSGLPPGTTASVPTHPTSCTTTPETWSGLVFWAFTRHCPLKSDPYAWVTILV